MALVVFTLVASFLVRETMGTSLRITRTTVQAAGSMTPAPVASE